jgi:hypothetical protein
MNKVLYKFRWDCGRMGSVGGVFVSTKEEIEKNIGEDVYFGEILGKHSEIYGVLEESDLNILTEDQDFIEKCILYGISEIGYNPLNYIGEE